MALARMYCGVAAAEMPSWLTVAAVDDAGRLLDVRHLSDDPAGYAHLGALLGDRVGGSPVAVDRPDHLVTQLLAAANRPLALADAATVDDLAERFCDETSYDEMRAPAGQRRAVGLARALQAGAIYVTAQSPAVEFEEFKPILAAHAAVTAGRQAAAVALREVLRELYPAALRAYPDPADYVPLKVLETLPEPGLLSPSPSNRSRDAALIAELSASGVADTSTAVAAITALQVAVTESPRWQNNRLLAPVVAETVRQSVAAVRACDAASAALVATMIERVAAISPRNRGFARPYLVAAAPVSPAPRRVAGPAAEVPAGRVSPRASAASAAAAGIGAGGPGLGGFGAAGAGYSTTPVPAAATIPPPRPAPGPAPGSRDNWPLVPVADNDLAVAYPGGQPASAGYGQDTEFASTLAFSLDPLNAPLHTPVAPRHIGQNHVGQNHVGQNHVGQNHIGQQQVGQHHVPPAQRQASQPVPTQALTTPPWLSEDMPAEPPSLRLVESPPSDPLTDPLVDTWAGQTAPPALRVIDGAGQSRGQADSSLNGKPDGDLLIFSEAARSAWFTDAAKVSLTDDTASWGRLADDGWRAAEQLAQPAVGADTTAGLPRRVPQANLVPGAAQAPRRQLRIVRDARSIAEHTNGYFRGWRRGYEIGGFAVGQRDRAAWEFNRDQRARESMDQPARLS